MFAPHPLPQYGHAVSPHQWQQPFTRGPSPPRFSDAANDKNRSFGEQSSWSHKFVIGHEMTSAASAKLLSTNAEANNRQLQKLMRDHLHPTAAPNHFSDPTAVVTSSSDSRHQCQMQQQQQRHPLILLSNDVVPKPVLDQIESEPADGHNHTSLLNCVGRSNSVGEDGFGVSWNTLLHGQQGVDVKAGCDDRTKIPSIVEEFCVDDDDGQPTSSSVAVESKRPSMRNERKGKIDARWSTLPATSSSPSLALQRPHPVMVPTKTDGSTCIRREETMKPLVLHFGQHGQHQSTASTRYHESGNDSMLTDDGDDDPTAGQFCTEKQRLKRERNKIAARNCRARKLNLIAGLQQRVERLKEQNRDLLEHLRRTENHVIRLKQHLERHILAGCDIAAHADLSDLQQQQLQYSPAVVSY